MKKIVNVLPYSLGYLLSCIFLCINATQAHYLAKDLGLTLVQSDWLTSIYLFGFFLGLFPVGVFLDRFSTKCIFSVFFTITGIGLFLFGFSSNLYVLIFARFIAGFGSSVALMAAFKVNYEVFPKNLATVNGVTMFMGGVGAFIAGKPIQLIFSHSSWHLCNIGLGILVIIIVTLTFILDTREPSLVNENNKTFLVQLSEIKIILREKNFILLCCLVIIPFGVFIAMFTFWTSQWLMHVDYFTVSAVAICISLMAIADFLGPLFWGVIADVFHKRGAKSETVILLGMVILFAVQILILLNITTGFADYLLWFFFVFFVQAGSLAFARTAGIFNNEYIGRAITTLEILMFATAFIIQLSFSYMLKFFNYFDFSTQLSFSCSFAIFLLLEVFFLLIYLVIPKKS